MTAIKLPGQLELDTVINHKLPAFANDGSGRVFEYQESRAAQIAKLLRDYENRPTSETWSRIQSLAAEILKCQ